MAKKAKKKPSKKAKSKKGLVYLSKRTLTRAITKGAKSATSSRKSALGHIVKEENGRIIKVFPDGRIEELSRVKTSRSSKNLVLD